MRYLLPTREVFLPVRDSWAARDVAAGRGPRLLDVTRITERDTIQVGVDPCVRHEAGGPCGRAAAVVDRFQPFRLSSAVRISVEAFHPAAGFSAFLSPRSDGS